MLFIFTNAFEKKLTNSNLCDRCRDGIYFSLVWFRLGKLCLLLLTTSSCLQFTRCKNKNLLEYATVCFSKKVNFVRPALKVERIFTTICDLSFALSRFH